MRYIEDEKGKKIAREIIEVLKKHKLTYNQALAILEEASDEILGNSKIS